MVRLITAVDISASDIDQLFVIDEIALFGIEKDMWSQPLVEQLQGAGWTSIGLAGQYHDGIGLGGLVHN